MTFESARITSQRPPEWWQDLSRRISQRIGFVMRDRERRKIEPFIDVEVKRSGARSWAAYLGALDAQHSDSRLWQRLLYHVVVGETTFFRNAAQFDLLRDQVLSRASRPLRFWSAGCSTGQEPYSIAMSCLEAGRDSDRIIATDVSMSVLETAAKGRVSARHNRPHPRTDRWLRRDENGCSVVEPVLSLITWKWHNLLDAGNFGAKYGPFDVIFCRNVLLYFTDDVVSQILTAFERSLSPDGWLFLGHAESLLFRNTSFRIVGGGLAYTKSRAGDVRSEPKHAKTSAGQTDAAPPMPTEPDDVVERAMELEAEGRNAQAAKLLISALNHGPGDMLIRLCLSGLYRRSGQIDAAARELQVLARHIEGRPDDEPVPGGDGMTIGALRQVVAPYVGGETR